MKFSVLLLTFLLFTATAFADTTQSRDGDGQKIQGAAYGYIQSKSLGTKGFACFSTASRMAWELRASATTLTDSTMLPFKYFINGSETKVYPVTTAFFTWQNSPTSKSPTVTKACMRAYSSQTEKTGYGVFQ